MGEAEEENKKQPKGKAGPTRSFDGSVVGPGSKIGPFRIEQELGRGGAGVVYLAHDTKLDRSVAIKSLPPEVKENPKALSRFTREARVLASLNHPNIATIYDELEEAEGLIYLVLEYVSGQTLAERIAKKPLKLEEALTIALQIAEAVSAAHEHDVVHRDLKPSNIKITREGKVKVLDFGLAKVVGGEATDQKTTITEPGRVIGTPAYMSPEQARGKPTDKRSDIWSFGCVLYEMLTATVPFKGETIPDTLANILQTNPNWQALPESTPANIQLLLRHCLEKEPRRRLRDIGDAAITIEDTTTELRRSTLPTGSVKAGRAKPAKWSRRALPWLVTTLAMVVLVPLGIIIGLKLGGPAEKKLGKHDSQPIVETIKAIVVLPFENLSGDPEQEYFVDGMTDALSAELGKIKALTVISRTSAMRYKNTEKSIPEIAKELGVDAVIEGSVLKARNDVRITAQLVDGRTDAHLWSDNYTGTLANILSLQSKVTLAIAREIEAVLTPEEESRIASKGTVNPEAYEAFLKSQFFYFKYTEAGFKSAVEYLEKAIAIDPNYAEAYARLAPAYWVPTIYGFASPQESFRKARWAADTAIGLDDSLSMAHRAAGWIALAYDWEWNKAEQKFNLARQLNPNDPLVYESLAWYFVMAGRFDQAIEMMQTALKLDPLSLLVKHDLGAIYSLSGQFEKAVEQHKNTLELDSNYLAAYIELATTYAAMSMYSEAVTEIERAMTLAGRKPSLLAIYTCIRALQGRKNEAQTLLVELEKQRDEWEKQSGDAYVSPVDLAAVYVSLGNEDRAFHWLDKAFDERSYMLLFLRYAWWWDPLRNNPKFNDLVERINFPEMPSSMSETKSSETTNIPIEKIAVPAIKRVSLEPLPSQTFLLISRGGSIAISPDGRYLVYVGVDAAGIQRLYLRDMTKDFEATPIRGTEGAMCPFFRPDGNWIGFFAKDKSTAECSLKRVRIQGGAPEFICTVPPVPCGGSWDLDDNIIFSPIYMQSLVSVSAFGGERKIFIRVDPNTGDFGHSWPDILPEQKGVLYTVWGGNSFTDYRTMIKWQDIDKPQELIPNSSFARYVPTGHVVFIREGSLQAVRFDIDHPGPEAIRGEAEILVEDIGVTIYGGTQLVFSRDEGTLVYVRGHTPLGLLEGEMVWVDPEAPNAIPIPESRRYYDEWCHPRLSPDENWIAVTPAYETNLLLYKFGTGWSPPLIYMKGYQSSAVWGPNGKHVAFYSMGPDSPPDVYWRLWNNGDIPELLYKTENSEQPTSFSPDGKYLALTIHHVPETGLAQTSDIWILEIATKQAEQWTHTQQCSEWGAAFSPDGEWIAYTSDEIGQKEVYVKKFPNGNAERVSISGGSEVMWGPDRENLELIYRDSKQLWRAAVETEKQFKVVRREPLFDDVYIKARFPEYRNYDISKDGKRFLMIKQVDEQPAPITQLKVVTNWFEELKRRVPSGKD